MEPAVSAAEVVELQLHAPDDDDDDEDDDVCRFMIDSERLRVQALYEIGNRGFWIFTVYCTCTCMYNIIIFVPFLLLALQCRLPHTLCNLHVHQKS